MKTIKKDRPAVMHTPFSVKFEPALLPETSQARAIVKHDGNEIEYRSEWTEEGTRAPLAAWRIGGRRMLEGMGPVVAGRAWLTDLDVVKSPSMIAVRTHGDDRGKVLAAQTTWFYHLRECPEDIWCLHALETRRAPLEWKLSAPATGLRIEGPGIRVSQRAAMMRLTAPEGERWLLRLTTATATPWHVDVEIDPPENERAFVDWRKPFELVVHLKNRSSLNLNDADLTVYGLKRVKRVRTHLGAHDSTTVRIPVRAGADRGIIPIAVRFEHAKAVGLGARSLWMPQVVLTSDQAWLDGMYAENLRSTVHRFTFNTWREDEPRYPCYRNGVYNRNIHSALIAMDKPRRLWGWIRLWLMALRSCGYMPEAFGLVTPPLRHGDWIEKNLKIGNDGTGFTLIQWGKLFLRADDTLRGEMLRTDLSDLRHMALYLRRSLHWTGQIEDHSEPVEGIPTGTWLAGSPYAQTLCLAGVLLVRRALETACGETEPSQELRALVDVYASLAQSLRAGLDRVSAQEGRFMDITIDQNQENPHTYTNLTPGMFLTDPDLASDIYSDRGVLEATLQANAAYHPEKRPFRVLTCPWWPPHPGFSHNAYSQIAAIISSLALNREEEAGRYLDDLIRNTQADFTRQRLSDPGYSVADWNVRDRAFARYIIPEGAVPGYDEIKLNPGNGVNVSYFLYLIDRMIGITPRDKHIEIAPQLAGQREWEVAGYPTNLGMVSYNINRNETNYQCEFRAEAPMDLNIPVPEKKFKLFLNEEAVKVEKRQEGLGIKAILSLPPGKHSIGIFFNQ